MKISRRDSVLLLVLAVLLTGVLYYMFYYTPYVEEMDRIAAQSVDIDNQIAVASAKVASMNAMQAELDEILSQPKDKITEIAPFDNAKVVMNQLNSILSATEKYTLKFKDPVIEKNGTVRREVTMQFNCETYANAKVMIKALSSSHWRCLINSISVDGVEIKYDDEIIAAHDAAVEAAKETGETVEDLLKYDALHGPVQVSATITFFESTNLS